MDNLIESTPAQWVQARDKETKLGERLLTYRSQGESYTQALDRYQEAGVCLVILGVPESIGPRANLGRGGAEGGFLAFEKQFANLQLAEDFPLKETLLLGALQCSDLMEAAQNLDTSRTEDLQQLRALCSQLDKRLIQVLQPLFDRDFEVILIGGGHNNAYPLLKSLSASAGVAPNAINLDPHADFRPLEGRHSGNGFSYAHAEGALANYYVVGLHESKNSQLSLQNLKKAEFAYLEDHQFKHLELKASLQKIAQQTAFWQGPLGIEVDIDSIQYAPASAYNTIGLPFHYAYTFVFEQAKYKKVRYLHLAEAAPSCHPVSFQAGEQQAGQILSELVLAWIRGRQQRV